MLTREVAPTPPHGAPPYRTEGRNGRTARFCVDALGIRCEACWEEQQVLSERCTRVAAGVSCSDLSGGAWISSATFCCWNLAAQRQSVAEPCRSMKPRVPP